PLTPVPTPGGYQKLGQGPAANLNHAALIKALLAAKQRYRTRANSADSSAHPEGRTGGWAGRDFLTDANHCWFGNRGLFQGQRLFGSCSPGADVHHHAPDQIHHDHQDNYWAKDCTGWVTSGRRNDDGGKLLDYLE